MPPRAPSLLLLGCTAAAGREPWCPEPWAESRCIGSSGTPASGFSRRGPADEAIKWDAGMAGHSHYTINPAKTALFVIDPQLVYAACPEPLDVGSLINFTAAVGVDGHSPLCCEQFGATIGNANRLAAAARQAGMPVFVHAHVYRDLDGDASTGDGGVDNLGRLGDFDVLGWSEWPPAWNLWNAELKGLPARPLGWSPVVYKDGDIDGFDAVFSMDYYAEKTIYSAMTEPVATRLRQLGVDTIIVTGYMTQYCVTTTSRAAHDLGFRVVTVTDAIDGPVLQQLLTKSDAMPGGLDENMAIPFYLGVSVADTSDTETLLAALNQKKKLASGGGEEL